VRGHVRVCVRATPYRGVARTHNALAPAEARTTLLHIKVLFFRKGLWGHDNIVVCSYVQSCAKNVHMTVYTWLYVGDLV